MAGCMLIDQWFDASECPVAVKERKAKAADNSVVKMLLFGGQPVARVEENAVAISMGLAAKQGMATFIEQCRLMSNFILLNERSGSMTTVRCLKNDVPHSCTSHKTTP